MLSWGNSPWRLVCDQNLGTAPEQEPLTRDDPEKALRGRVRPYALELVTPMAIGKDECRKVLARFATGVTVITVAKEGGQVHGMTANAFASVSLDPPLVLVCVDHRARTHPLLLAQKRFGVNVLREEQRAIADYHADASQDHETAHHLGIEYWHTPSGTPMLKPCLAQLECRLVSAHQAGDHTIFVGEVEQAAAQEGRPLLFYASRYRKLESDSP